MNNSTHVVTLFPQEPMHQQLRVNKQRRKHAVSHSLNDIDRSDAGLTSIEGAQSVIQEISKRHKFTGLILGHNKLGDAGCTALFDYLSSPDGQKHPIRQVSLNSNSVGNDGLYAIASYLEGNRHTQELFLQNGDGLGTILARAVNRSHLQILSLTMNPGLGDPFLSAFLADLDSPFLRELHLSAMNLSSACLPAISTFISSDRCHLQTLKCNGNYLGLRVVRSIVQTVERHNFSLLTVEMHSNQLAGSATDAEDGQGTWTDAERLLRSVLLRNDFLQRQVQHDALRLLYYSRSLLCASKRTRSSSASDTPCDACSSSSSSSAPTSPPPLPLEILQHILSYFAPTLSTAQRLRVFRFATDPSTLPPLRDCVQCVPDPMSYGTALPRKNVWVLSDSGNVNGRGCTSGKCMGGANSIVCHRERERVSWLARVGCERYECKQL
ncbi:hypothetical protein FISHEDRAFT_65932 [Fistulina hepatica ATCC 64428]|uniref:RNI-like protein n=1 Tax=Fistulina hepatica ATCC 64428 TaxID=1128425 RepID=A0A0D7ABW1_9AGAR|nr:hypothetical protein FISHEDRAFT_65932 [Fistulina hepatica ATCC 64428]